MLRTNSYDTVGQILSDAADIQVGGDRPWDIEVHDDRFFDRVLRDRELGLGESYQDGWWDAHAVDQFVARLQLADLQSQLRPSSDLLALSVKARVSNRQTRRRSAHNARAHYDIGNDLYERMLDDRMVYSCAYWAGARDLAHAQESKLDLICRKLELEPGMTLLDIGCGWGGLARYAAQHYGAVVTGITPAATQVTLARVRTADLPVTIEQLDYRDVAGSFDRIVSVGMMEHIGPRNLGSFFDACFALLREDGLMLHHTIGSSESKAHGDPWFDKYIFPGGVVPSLHQIAGASQQDWVIEDVHNFGPDYDTTLMAWLDNIDGRWHEIPHYDTRFQRTWRYYLMGSAAAFRTRSLQVWQIVMRRTRQSTPVYRAHRRPLLEPR